METLKDSSSMNSRVNEILSEYGFESHPFLVGWYNDLVSEKFHLNYPPNTSACIIISQPSMYEKAFLPFLQQEFDPKVTRDPIDQCMVHYFSKVKNILSDVEVVSLHDFEVDPRRRPRILVQTAGHVSGAVRYYKPCDVQVEQRNNNFYPVCHHPRWGGWFALRGVLIFPGLEDSTLVRPQPPDLLSPCEAGEMLELYNLHWQDWRWRDVGCPEEKYSPAQIKYFETPPAERFKLIQDYLANNNPSQDESSS
eukprot:TRINITY_DN6021_c0_g1_i4.p1 TRINITY_DN6021_c0_g1~~TRINITY_DN6021_c0_g1_i4.p1  ORF type:complete len:252 (-),score=35.19 TRINITY_DN6021_c0_g1_i4:153-908(-)